MNSRFLPVRWTGVVILAVLAGCEQSAPPPALPAQSSGASASQPTSAELASLRDFVKDAGPKMPSGLPAGHPPIDMSQMPGAEPAGPARAPGVALKYEAPQEWVKEPPKSSMRRDQFRLPRAEPDAEDGELAVFDSSVGGGVEANVARWRSQFTLPDGQPIPDEVFAREAWEVQGMKVTFVDVLGRYNAGMAMGAPAEPKDNYRLLAAIVETPGGPWYFKGVGPAATMARHRENFLAFLKTVGVE